MRAKSIELIPLYVLCNNSLTPRSDGYVNSLYSLYEMSVKQVSGKEVWSWYNTKFSWLSNKNLYGTSWENERLDRGNERVYVDKRQSQITKWLKSFLMQRALNMKWIIEQQIQIKIYVEYWMGILNKSLKMEEKGPQIPIIIQTKMFNQGVTPIMKLTLFLGQYMSHAYTISTLRLLKFR